jgi:outer membrane protein OmpA-like peptidoglycan-associated protein
MNKFRSGAVLVATLAVGGLTLSGCATKGYVNDRIAEVNQKIDATNAKVDQVNGKVDALSARVDGVDKNANAAMERANAAYTLAEGKFTETQVGDTISVYFDTAKYTLRDDGKATLNDLAQKLINDNKNVVLEVVGHCDPRGGKHYNRELGRWRAAQVARYLYSQGVPLNREQIASWGEEKAAAKGESAEDLQKDRRVDITIKTSS